jgi:hypothetical protein
MNGERYQEVLEYHLLLFMAIDRCTHFLQDGALCHSSKRVKNYLSDKPFVLMDWPGNSPDLNPIENVWNHMKNKLQAEDISLVPRLKESLIKMWTQDIALEYLSNLSRSMPRRLKEVISCKGDMFKSWFCKFPSQIYDFFRTALFYLLKGTCFVLQFLYRKLLFCI